MINSIYNKKLIQSKVKAIKILIRDNSNEIKTIVQYYKSLTNRCILRLDFHL